MYMYQPIVARFLLKLIPFMIDSMLIVNIIVINRSTGCMPIFISTGQILGLQEN